jgi:hypothetical protein
MIYPVKQSVKAKAKNFRANKKVYQLPVIPPYHGVIQAKKPHSWMTVDGHRIHLTRLSA